MRATALVSAAFALIVSFFVNGAAAHDFIVILSPAQGTTYQEKRPIATSFMVGCDRRDTVGWQVRVLESTSDPLGLGRSRFERFASFTGAITLSQGRYEFLVAAECAGEERVVFTVVPPPAR